MNSPSSGNNSPWPCQSPSRHDHNDHHSPFHGSNAQQFDRRHGHCATPQRNMSRNNCSDCPRQGQSAPRHGHNHCSPSHGSNAQRCHNTHTAPQQTNRQTPQSVHSCPPNCCGPQHTPQDKGDNWQACMTGDQKKDWDAWNHRLKSESQSTQKTRNQRTFSAALDRSSSAVDKASKASEEASKASQLVTKELSETNKKALSTADKASETNKSALLTADKATGEASETIKKALSTVDKALELVALGEKRKASEDEAGVAPRKKMRETELQDNASDAVVFAGQRFGIAEALIFRESLATMTHKVHQNETNVLDPKILKDMPDFTSLKTELHDIAHLRRALSQAEKDKVHQLGCTIIDQNVQEGPSSSVTNNELWTALNMSYEERQALHEKRNLGRINKNSKALLEEKQALSNTVNGLQKEAKQKDERIQKLEDFRSKERDNHHTELLDLKKDHKGELSNLKKDHKEELSNLKNEVLILKGDKKELRDEKNEYKAEVENLKIERNNYRDENASLKDELAKYKEELAKLKDKDAGASD